jgi:hypothetical protein
VHNAELLTNPDNWQQMATLSAHEFATAKTLKLLELSKIRGMHHRKIANLQSKPSTSR